MAKIALRRLKLAGACTAPEIEARLWVESAGSREAIEKAEGKS
jgi:hypothetical protein